MVMASRVGEGMLLKTLHTRIHKKPTPERGAPFADFIFRDTPYVNQHNEERHFDR